MLDTFKTTELMAGLLRIDLDLVPETTRREVIANALVHWDYSEPGPTSVRKTETVQGGTFTVNVMDGKVSLTDGAGNTVNFVTTDIIASNGVIHVIDAVLLPKGWPVPAEPLSGRPGSGSAPYRQSGVRQAVSFPLRSGQFTYSAGIAARMSMT